MGDKHDHSPLPWESVYPEGSKQRCAGVISNDHYVYLSNFDGGYVRETITMQQANADLIAKAVNAHAKLVAALKGLLARHGDGSDEGPWAEWDTAREALREIGE